VTDDGDGEQTVELDKENDVSKAFACESKSAAPERVNVLASRTTLDPVLGKAAKIRIGKALDAMYAAFDDGLSDAPFEAVLRRLEQRSKR